MLSLYTAAYTNSAIHWQANIAVREYLNTAKRRANPRGVCNVISKYFESQNTAVDMMRIEAVLQNCRESQTGNSRRKEISERTARRWLLKIGWLWGKDKKGYCDGHEREDVVQYREKVFCPRMKVSTTNI